MSDTIIYGREPDDLFGLASFQTLSNAYRSCPSAVKNQTIKDVARAFVGNLDRPYRLATFLPMMCFRTMLRANWECNARFSVLGKLDSDPAPEEKRAELFSALQKQFRDFADFQSRDPDRFRSLMANEYWQIGVNALNELIVAPDEANPVRDAVEVIIASVLLGSWTAFEALAADLWVAALNERPRLGIVALGADKSSTDSDEQREQKAKVKFILPAGLLRDLKYDLKSHMGTVLREKWDFGRRSEAKDAYLKTFREKAEKERLTSILDDQKLIWMAAIRNSIVHDGAVADRQFVSQMERHPTLSAVKEHHAIPLRGPLVREFIDIASQRGIELIEFVDGWLAVNE